MSSPDMHGFPRTARTVHLGAMSIQIETVRSFDALLDQYAESDPTAVDRIPYFAQLWPAAIALAKFLVEPPNASPPKLFSGLRAIELGCGLGLPSIVAARLGATVLAVDFHPDNETLFRRNAAVNNVGDIQYLTADWSALSGVRPFDLVLGSDLLYERRTLNSLVDTMTRLCAPGGTILLSDPGRDAVQPVVAEIESRGFRPWTHVIDECFIVEFSRPPGH